MSGSVVSELVLKFTGDTSGALAAIGLLDSKVAASAKNYVASMGSMDNSLAKMVASHPVALASAAALGVGLVYLGVKAVEAGVSFDKAMELSVTQAGLTEGAVASMSQKILALGPQVGQTSTALADAFYHIASASHAMGLTASQQYDMLKIAAEGAAVGHANLTDTTNALIAAVTSGIPGVQNYGQAMGTMNAIVGAGNMKMQDLNAAFGTGALGVMASYGVSLSSVGTVLAFMTTQGTSADSAMTRLKMSVALIGGPTKASQGVLSALGLSMTEIGTRSQAMSDALKKAGVSQSQLSADLKKPDGIVVALQDLKAGMEKDGISASEQAAVITRAFGGGKMGSTILDLYTNLDKLPKVFNQIGAGANDFGKAWATTQKTAAFQAEQLKASFNSIETAVGTALLPVLQTLLGIILKVVIPMAEWAANNKTLVTIILAVVGAVTALTLGIIVMAAVVGAFTTVFGALTASVIVFDVAILPVWAVLLIGIAIIAAVIAIIIVMIKYWDDITAAFKTVVGWIAQAVDWFMQLSLPMKILIGILALLIAPFLAVIAVIVLLYQNWSTVWNAITDIIKIFYSNILQPIFSSIVQTITLAWNVVSAITTATWNTVVTVVEALWNSLLAVAVAVFTGIRDAVQVVWNAISTAASTMWNAISAAIQAIWNVLKAAAVTIFTALQNAIQAVWNTISTAANTMWNSISNNVIQPIWNGLKAAASTVFTGIQNVIQGVWDNIKGAASTMWNAIVAAVKSAWDQITSVVGTPITAVINVVNGFINGANTVLGIVGVPKIPDIPAVKFATGGTVPGGWGGGDTVPAMLTPGERVLSTGQVRQMGGHHQIDNMLGMTHGGPVPGVQYFDSGGIVSGGMSNGAFHGSWKDNVDGNTYQDVDPSGGHFVDANTLTGYVNGTGSPAKGPSGISQVGGAIGVVTSALAGLGKVFIKGALIAAADVALAPLKAAVGALPSTPLGAGVGKGTANKVLDGIYNFITQQDAAKGIDPIASSGYGVTGSVSVAQEAAALAYAVSHFMGLPYTWGNNDCSGIVQKSYAAQGVSLPRVSSTQWGASVPVSSATAVPGDLAFYNPGTSGAPAGLPGHVGFYAGPGKLFDAYNTSRPIGYDSLSLPGNTFMGLRRPGGIAGSGGGGPVALPNGFGPGVAITAQQWAAELLAMLGVAPSPGMVNFIWEWEASEGGTWANSLPHNPLNVAAFDNNVNNATSAGMTTWAAGLAKTVQVLQQSNFTGLLAGIKSGNPASALAALVASPWASSHYNGGASFPKSPGSYGSTPHLSEGGIVGYSVGGMASGVIRVGENGPETIDLGDRNGYVNRNGSVSTSGIDYDKLAAAMQANSGVQIGNINVTQSDASPSDIVDEFNWNMRVSRLAVQ